MDHVVKHIDKILSEALVKNNVLPEKMAKQYCADAKDAQRSLRDFLLENHVVTERQIIIALSQILNLEMVDFHKITVEKEVIDHVPIKFAWYYRFMPVRLEQDILTIACEAPLDIKIQDEIRQHLGFQINVALAEEPALKDALKKYYGFASDMIDKIMAKEPVVAKISSSDDGKWIEDLERQTEDPTVSHLVNQIILEAYKKRATDIHIEPYRNKVRFRYRIDGCLVDANLPKEAKHFLSPILSRIKILANLSITEKRLPQDGSAVVKTQDQQLDLRISTIPTPRGESMVIRILPTKVMLLSLEKLGFDPQSVKQFRELIKRPHGIIFITGPTGSGKTTTLYACLNEINAPERKIITIEDPVEYEMEGITQVQVNPKLNFDFSTGLRSILRHDPDILMIGEVRDVDTAKIAIRTALTGHLVFSTLHTNDSASGVTRLIDMGVEPYLVSSSVEAFIAQRLVRVICPKCKEEMKGSLLSVRGEIAKSLHRQDLENMKIYHGKGCDYCNHTGFYGRIAIYEVMLFNDMIRSAILEKPRADHIKRITMKCGLTTLRQNGWHAVLDGITTPNEVLNVTTEDESLEDEPQHPQTVVPKTLVATHKEFKHTRVHKRESWQDNNQYDARVYPRAFVPVELRYRLLRLDPKDPNFLLADGVEYTTVTEDISAGGMRFISSGAYPIGSILEVKIKFGEGKAVISCLAKVCRVEKDDLDQVYTVVNYYLDLSSADRVVISRFVDECVSGKIPQHAQSKRA